MRFPFVFTEGALEDIIHQLLYYETVQPGLGDRFMNEVMVGAKEISILPLGYEAGIKAQEREILKIFLIN